MKARLAGVHLLELEDGLILLRGGGSIGHGSCKSSQDVWIYHIMSKEEETWSRAILPPGDWLVKVPSSYLRKLKSSSSAHPLASLTLSILSSTPNCPRLNFGLDHMIGLTVV